MRTPHIEADYHLQLRPGTNVAMINALAHVIVTEGLARGASTSPSAAKHESWRKWKAFVSDPRRIRRKPWKPSPACRLMSCAARRACMRNARNGAIYYGLGVTEHSQGTTMVMGIANLAMATGNLGREGVGVNPLRGQNNVQGSCDMGSFPHEFSGYRHVSDDAVRALFESAWGVPLEAEPGLRIPNMFEAALDGSFRALYIQGEDIAQSDPNTQHVTAALSRDGMRRRAGPVPERDGEVRARVPAGLVVPGEGRHVHERRAAHLARAQGHGAAGRACRTGRSRCVCLECARLSR